MSRIAVLNRGEAATRCLRAIRELRAETGWSLVGIAFYTDPDRHAAFVREADEALSLGSALRGPETARRPAYLDHERVLAALRATRADAVWPGWGFLAEDASFVERLEAAELVFLGPRSDTMRMLGDKIRSKRLAEAAAVPVTPWSGGPVEAETAGAVAAEIGYPLMLKATAGGGGRGIRRVETPDQLEAHFRSATNEAAQSFGDGTLFLESCVKDARHVEVQVAADRHGNALAVGLRDCSVQRRHQKIVEEGPPPGLPARLLEDMRQASLRLVGEAGYEGVATCEYLVTPDEAFYFLEVNPRLQVEHGVTEMLTGFDLVKAQIRIARGEALPETAPEERGHAIEVRVCAEDPAAGFAPSPGKIAYLELPAGPGVRVDSGLALDGHVPAEFDSMLAKVISHGATREEARARLVRATRDLGVVVEGGMVNKGFLLDVLEHPDFRNGGVHTGWLEAAGLRTEPAPCVQALVIGAILTHQRERSSQRLNFFAEASLGRPRHIPPSTGSEIDLVYGGNPYRLKVFAIGGWTYRVHLNEAVVQAALLEQGAYRFLLQLSGERHNVLVSDSDVELRVEVDGHLHRVHRDVGGRVRASAPALVIEVSAQPGQSVVAGQRLGLLEAMKTETAFTAPFAGTVREVLVRGGERVAAGDVLLVLEPAGEEDVAQAGSGPISFPGEGDALDVLFDDAGRPALSEAARKSSGSRADAVGVLRSEIRRILMGYDVNRPRADRLVDVLEAPTEDINEVFRAELGGLLRDLELFVDIESLFSRAPTRLEGDELGPSNDARMAMYLRRIGAEGAGIATDFLDELRTSLRHYDVPSLEPNEALQRAVLRLYATRTTNELRTRLVVSLLQLAIRLGQQGETFALRPEFERVLDRLALLRGTVPPAVADLASHARFVLFERPRGERDRGDLEPAPAPLEHTLVPAPDAGRLRRLADEVSLSLEEAERIELWRLENFELEQIETFEGVYTFRGRARDRSGDERLFCIAEVGDLGRGAPQQPDVARFEQRFQEAIEALRVLQAACDPLRRLQWNRLYLILRPPIVLRAELLTGTLRRLAPQTGHLGLEKVIVRLASVDPDAPDAPPRTIEVLAGNPTGSRVESSIRDPHRYPLAPATPYERRVAAARARGLIDPYEVVRLFTAPPSRTGAGPAAPIGPGAFTEYDLERGEARPVARPPGQNTCGVVIGVISTPVPKYAEGMRRVVILGDASFGMGALAGPECDRIVAAIELAEREQLPVEWVAVSSGARIAMDSGTENLDATARVVRRLVTFTDAGGEVNVIVAGVNVGAQSYFDALATMGLQSRGILVMLPSSSMVLTGRAALEVSGAVAAEDEVGIGGYERIMGPTGQAQFQARDIADAYHLLLSHYAVAYCAPGEAGPRRFPTRDPFERDITASPCDGEEGFASVGEIFSAEANAERKRPFAMRPLMRALVDQDTGFVERWRDWAGAETAIAWDCHLGGHPVALIGVESRPLARVGHVPNDGPDTWTAGTLFPLSSKKVARALNAASGNRPGLVLANLSGFDGSPESMRRGVLELGAEIARSVVRFQGPLLFVVVSRYHGGAYVVFSRELNDDMRVVALAGSFASVIGGSAAASVVFPREVRRRASSDPRVEEARGLVSTAPDPATRAASRARLEELLRRVTLEKQAEVAAEFDAVHSVERAREVGSLEQILEPALLRPTLIGFLDRT